MIWTYQLIDDCVGATSSGKEELNQFINSVLLSSPKTWGISKNFCFSRHQILDQQQRSIQQRTWHSSHPKDPKKSVPFSQFLGLKRLLSDNFDFCEKAKEIGQFFLFFLTVATPTLVSLRKTPRSRRSIEKPRHKHHKKRRTTYYWIQFTLTYQPHNLSVKASSLKTSKFYKNDPEAIPIFSLPLIVSCEGVKNSKISRQRRCKIWQSTGNPQMEKLAMQNLSFLPKCHRYRRTLATININDRFTWVNSHLIYSCED